jgi:hypothetical protein
MEERVQMKSGYRNVVAALGAAPALTGCELIGDIFQAGVWVGVIIVVVVIAAALWGLSKLRR